MKYDEFIKSREYRKSYDVCVSLGMNCHISSVLRQLSLQHKSYPLDWGRVVEEHDVLGFRRKIEFICTYFKDFINESDLYIHDYMEHHPEEKNVSVYNSFNGMHFIHDFQKGKTIAESYSDVKAKYDRRVERLMNLINSDKKICFVFYAGLDKLLMSEIIYMTEIFYKIFPKANVDFLILQNDLDVGDNVIYEELSDKIRRVSFYNGPYEEEYQADIDEIIDKLKCVLNALLKKDFFPAKELSSKNCVDNVITNPSPDFQGITSFGPYIPLDIGAHSVTVDFELSDNYRAFVDVACDKGKVIMPKTELPHDTNKFKFEFNLDKNVVDLEVRFYCEPSEKIDENNKFKLFGIHVN